MTCATRTLEFARVSSVQLPRHAPALFESVSSPRSIGVSLTGHERVEFELDGRARRASLAPGAVQLVADAPVRWIDVPEPSACVEIELSETALAPWGGVSTLEARSDREPARDTLGLALALRLAQSLGTAATEDNLELESCVLALVERVLGPVRTDGRALRLDAVLEHIEARVNTPGPRENALSLTELAQVAGVSVHHFARRFRAQTGFAPHAYVQSRRMARAWELLTRTSASVSEIARECGYESTSHFHSQFRRAYGRSPSATRD